MKTIQLELTDIQAFDDLVHLDCVKEILHERFIDVQVDHDDAVAILNFSHTISRLIREYEKVVIVPTKD